MLGELIIRFAQATVISATLLLGVLAIHEVSKTEQPQPKHEQIKK